MTDLTMKAFVSNSEKPYLIRVLSKHGIPNNLMPFIAQVAVENGQV